MEFVGNRSEGINPNLWKSLCKKAKSCLMPKTFSGQICGSTDEIPSRIESRKILQNCEWWVGHGQGNPLAAPLQSGRQHLCSNPNALSSWKGKWGQQNHFGDKSGTISNYVWGVFLSKLKTNTQKIMANLLQRAGKIAVSFTQKIRSKSPLFLLIFHMLFPYKIFDIKHLEALMESQKHPYKCNRNYEWHKIHY